MPDSIFGREQELLELRGRLGKRKPLLIHGPEGVGKTLLVKSLLPEMSEFVYCPESATIQSVFRTVMEILWERGDERVRHSCGRTGLSAVRSKSATNVKGVVMDAFHDGNYCLALDHLRRPAYSFAAGVREILHWGGTSVIAIARSAHMEDVGFLQGLYPDKTDRYEIRNFDRDMATKFAMEVSQQLRVNAENFAEFLDRVLEYSHGNPGAMVSMLKMATYPKYRLNDHIKIAPLYIDFRMSWQPRTVRRGTVN
jgi:hypothetical protein